MFWGWGRVVVVFEGSEVGWNEVGRYLRGGLSFRELACRRFVLRAFSFVCTEVPLCPLVEATRNSRRNGLLGRV